MYLAINTTILGRHGSAFLCRVERKNKMAATYNVLAFKRWYFTRWWILYVQGHCSLALPHLTEARRVLYTVTKVTNLETVKIEFRHLMIFVFFFLSSSAVLAPLREQCRDQNTHEQSWNSPGRCLLNFVFSETAIYILRVLDRDPLSAKC